MAKDYFKTQEVVPEKLTETLTRKEIFTLYAMQALLTRTDFTATTLPARALQAATETLRALDESK